jgi:hypothetical protein
MDFSFRFNEINCLHSAYELVKQGKMFTYFYNKFRPVNHIGSVWLWHWVTVWLWHWVTVWLWHWVTVWLWHWVTVWLWHWVTVWLWHWVTVWLWHWVTVWLWHWVTVWLWHWVTVWLWHWVTVLSWHSVHSWGPLQIHCSVIFHKTHCAQSHLTSGALIHSSLSLAARTTRTAAQFGTQCCWPVLLWRLSSPKHFFSPLHLTVIGWQQPEFHLLLPPPV